MADIKYSMEEHVKENFLDPLHSVQMHELKEINVNFIYYLVYLFLMFILQINFILNINPVW